MDVCAGPRAMLAPVRVRIEWYLVGLLVILTVMVVYIGRGNILPNFTQSMDGQGPPEKVEGIVPVSQQPPMKETDKEKEKEVNKDKPLHPFDNPKWARMDEAYVFIITNDKPMHEIWALEGSLRNVSSTRRRIALVTDGVSEMARDALKKMEIEVRAVPNVKHPNFKASEPRWKDTLSKLNLFDEGSMHGIRKWYYLDADIYMNKNMDDMFDLDTSNGTIHAMRDEAGCSLNSPNLNGGLLIGSPNNATRNAILASLDGPDNPTKNGVGDQELFNNYFKKGNKIRFRPEMDMAFLWRCDCMKKKEIPYYDTHQVRALHFTGWWIDTPYLVKNHRVDPVTMSCAVHWYQRWIHAHDQLKWWWEKKYNMPMPNFPLVKM